MSLFQRVSLVLVVSGYCSLVYQVAWLRLLRLVFGSSTASTAVVLAIFMGGLGFGGIYFGRRSQRTSRLLRLYAGLELGIGLTAAASPLLIELARRLYHGLGGAGTLGLGPATLLRIALSVVILGLPTTLMGGTLPVVAQAMERDSDRGRRRIAWLYGLNTLGAVGGAFLTTFVWIEWLGVRNTLWLAALLNLLLAMVVRHMARREPAAAAPESAASTAGAPPARELRLVLVAAGVVGFLFFLMEIVWYRMLAPILGGSSYTFGLILAVALLGIGLGGALYALGAEDRRPTPASLAVTCALEGLCLAVPFAFGDSVPLVAAALRSLGALGFPGLVAVWALVTGLVMFPAAVVAGYQFPLLVALLGSGRRRAGREVGLVYAWNTWGAILGSFAGGFGLLPLLTAPHLWRLSALALGILALALPVVAGLPWRRWLLPAAGFAVILALSLAPGPSAFWRHVPIGAGRLDTFDSPNAWLEARQQIRRSVVAEADGVESSVALLGYEELSLQVNGKSDGAARTDAPTMVMSGLVGAALHPAPRRALIIGLGTGCTAGWLTEVGTLERVDVVELEPVVIDFAHRFDPITFDVLDDPKVEILVGDGRELVLTSRQTYDLIFSEPSNPYRAGVADFFSRDFYDAVVERLAPGGVFLQWLQGYEVDSSVVATAFATIGSVFPAVETWQINGTDLLLVATREPLVHDPRLLRRRLDREPFRTALRRVWRVDGLEGFYSGYVGDPRLAAYLKERRGAVSTDDRPLIEFGFVRNVGRLGLFAPEDLQILSRSLGTQFPPGLSADRLSADRAGIDWRLVEELRQVRSTVRTFRMPPPETLDDEERARWSARQAYERSDLRAAARLWFSQPSPPLSQLDRLLITEVQAEGGVDGAETAIASLGGEAPTEAAFLEARWRWRRGEAAEAAEILARAFERLRDDPWVFRPLARRSFPLLLEMARADPARVPRFFAALSEPFAVRLFDETRRLHRVELLEAGHFEALCGAAFASFEPHILWTRAFLERRRRCYRSTGHPLLDRAERDLDRFVAREPPRLGG